MPAHLVDSTAKKILAGYYAAFFLLLVSLLLTFFTNSRLGTHAAGVEQTNRLVRSLQALLAEVKNAESAFHGFLIIHEENFLDPYRGSYSQADSILKELYISLGDNHVQRMRLDTISGLLKERYDLFESGLRSFYQYEAGDTIVGKIIGGKIITDQLDQVLGEMETTENTALKERTSQLEMYSRAVVPVNLFTLALAVTMAAYSLITYNRERKAVDVANKARKDKEDQLEQKVNELRKANDELVKFRRMEKFAATGRMSRIIAHEVRNPLSNINLALGQLKDEIPNDENSTMLLDMIMRNSVRINQLVTDLLNATRVQDMNFSSVSVNTLLDEALTAAADRAQLNQIEVRKEYASGMCNVNADAEKLKIAFLNIIVNAIEAMEPGKGVLRLKTENKNGKCMITISDNGVGIDRESFAKLFEPYFTNKPKGSGLGLANTQAIILTHKGHIEVESEPGKGATFTVTLDFTEG